MDAAAALAELQEISTQIRGAVLLDEGGEPVASTVSGTAGLARAARELIVAADELRRSQGRTLVRLRVMTRDGAVYAARGERGWLVATFDVSMPETLAFYDLDNCLRALSERAGAAA